MRRVADGSEGEGGSGEFPVLACASGWCGSLKLLCRVKWGVFRPRLRFGLVWLADTSVSGEVGSFPSSLALRVGVAR